MEYSEELVEYIVMLKIEDMELNQTNIVKLLKYDCKITDNYINWEVKGDKIINYGICEPYPPISFKEYIPHFIDAMCWAVSGESEENANKLLKDFIKLDLIYKR